jgi:NAD(P)-dependent dehydrogenase (short-subunit alcohol dehydrogenase family)
VSLLGATAVVTGARGGIGGATVRLFRDAGARVFAVDLSAAGGAEDGDGYVCDVTDLQAVRDLAEHVRETSGALDLLVHCAGIVRDAVLWKMDPEEWSAVLATNLTSAFHLLHELIPLLRRSEQGAVVLVSSINAERGKFGQANYAASKAGLLGLSRTAARELGRFGVRVNVLEPGFIRTPMTAALPEEIERQALAETALGRVGDAEDVARCALFLCSDLAGHVTGQVLRVDGGQLMA